MNPIRAGLVARPEEYRWSSMGYHFQTGSKDEFLSWDFGLTEFGESGKEDRLHRHRQYVKDHFQSLHEKKPQRISGLDGIYSLKRLVET